MKLSTFAVAAILTLGACKPSLTPEAYAAQWAEVQAEYERTTKLLPEPVVGENPTPEKARAAVAKALRSSAVLLEGVARKQDALKPPREFAQLQKLSSAYFHGEVQLFREFADAVDDKAARDAVKAKLAAHHEVQAKAVAAEAKRLGLEAG